MPQVSKCTHRFSFLLQFIKPMEVNNSKIYNKTSKIVVRVNSILKNNKGLFNMWPFYTAAKLNLETSYIFFIQIKCE